MARSAADLLALQGDIKRDSDGYSDEFKLQYRHYQASLDVFNLKPSKESREFAELVTFVAQVCQCYPRETEAFAGELIQLLDTHHAVLDPALRRSLVKALILLRNRGQLSAAQLHPLFFRLFRCQDKGLRQLLFRHIVADIKGANQKQRNERLNRSAQNFLYACIGGEGEAAAKPALAVLTELWRRHVWRDARTANVIASAVFHDSPRILLAAVKFFLGQDEIAEGGGDSDDEGGDGGEKEARAVNPTKAEVYNASKKGTTSSKKKKMAKLKRVMATVKRQERREKRDAGHNFAAIQLLHDPQSFAERLFSQLQRGGGGEKFDTRLAVMVLVSRVVGVHRLLLLNFYPFLQKYLQPHQRDVTQLLAALVQACHDLVPPDALAPVLRQLVDSFVHDRARPEVMTLGLKTVRELCARTPLVMTPDLLKDLALYKKFRNKEVASAARGLIGLFRELAPSMLEKRDRGRGAELDAKPLGYGASRIATRVEGAELLQEAEARGDADLDEEAGSGAELSEDGFSKGDEEARAVADESEEEGGVSDEEDAVAAGEGMDSDAEGDEEDEEGGEEISGSGGGVSDAGSSGQEAGSSEDEEPAAIASGSGRRKQLRDAGAEDGEEAVGMTGGSGRKRAADPESLSSLKRQLEAAGRAKRARTEEAAEQQHREAGGQLADAEDDAAAAALVTVQPETDATAAPAAEEPLEYGRILTEEDFARIHQLRRRRMVEGVMRKHGLKSAAKRERLLAEAEDEADEAMAEQDARAVIGELRVDPASLAGRHRARKDKAERMASVLEGREGREFGSAAARKKQKSGGTSNRQKAKAKNMPAPAKAQAMKRRMEKARKGNGKNFKGRAARSRR